MLAPQQDQRAWEAETDRLNERIKELRELYNNSSGEEKRRFGKQIADLQYALPPHLPTIPSTRNDAQKRTAIHVLKRGIWENKGVPVGPRPPSVLVNRELPELIGDAAHPRTRLARWIADEENPLTARVIVNRLWQHHFVAGLVRTANDFGTHGDRPSHPALLDWLAAELVEGGWRLKPLHRMIVLSATYRQASDSPRAATYSEVDPANQLLWQFPRRRLSAEELRDALLAVAGRLQLDVGGPSVMVPVDEALVALLYKPRQWRVAADVRQHDRRSIYLIAKRNLRLPFFEAFDGPALQTSCPRRQTSTHAPQALELLNGEFANAMAVAFAGRLRREFELDEEPPRDPEVARRVIQRSFQLALGRTPTNEEHGLALAFVRDQPLEEFALALFNLNGFAYVR